MLTVYIYARVYMRNDKVRACTKVHAHTGIMYK